MTHKKRILALAASIVILMSSIVAAIVPASAVDYYYTIPYVTSYNGSDVNYGVNTLDDYYNVRSHALDVYEVDVFSFEILYDIMGGERPQTINYPVSVDNTGKYYWNMPYNASINNNPADVVLRFYVSDPNWPFEIRYTVTNGLVFSNSGVTPSLSHNNVYYYDFTVDYNPNDLISITKGWYIYSDAPVRGYSPDFVPDEPDEPGEDVSVITVNYLYDGNVISSESYNHDNVDYPFYQSVVAPAGYLVADSNVRDHGIYFPNGISSDVTYNLDVITVAQFAIDQFNNGYDSGYDSGYDEGLNYGYSTGYDLGYDQGYDDGYELGFERGEEYGRTQAESVVIENPLQWLIEPVASFLAIEPYPGLPIGIIFVAAVAISLVVIFLKIFAGG